VSDYVVVAHEQGDADRAATIIKALRDAGIEVQGDTPVTDPIDPAMEAAIDGAWVVLALWSRHSTDRDGPQALFRAVEAPAQRGAYLGVMLDGAPTPFGFGGLHSTDLGKWGGGNDKALAGLVDTVKQRMKLGPVANVGGAEEEAIDPDAKRRRNTMLAIVAAVVLVLAAGGYFLFFRSTPSIRQQIDAKLFAIPCAWLKVDPVNDGSNGTLALTGVADQPDRAGETIRGLVKGGPKPITVTIDQVAQIGSNECPAIDVPRRLRQDDGGQLRVESADVGRDKSMGLAEARVILNLASSSKSMALFGIEPSGKVTWILPDRTALDGLKEQDVGFSHDSGNHYEFTLRADHLGWTGLLLVTGDRPLPNNKPQMTVTGSHDFGDWLQSATDHGDWHTEMTWYRIQPR